MIRWQGVIVAVPVAAALAGGFAYFVTPPPRIEAERRLAPTAPDVTGSATRKPTEIIQRLSAEDYARAAEALLKQLPDAQASARADDSPILGHIHDQDGAQSDGDAGPPTRFSLRPRSRAGRRPMHGQ
jgi:hypothetical protein